ncbi:MAG: Crp/Fnr family transcriptional regulator [Cyclobacteriaceae bacterium]|jgi:CRP-like cAMP-binding protein|nr:Crp/Fnr family transcriptional regulator [Cyclobacteriaceae bacterium]
MAALIPKALGARYGAQIACFRKTESLFREGDKPAFFFQLQSGMVKMVTGSEAGREFIQGVFGVGDSFGEPPLFCGGTYPATAYALTDGEVMKIPKESFFDLLRNHFDIHIKFDQVLCQRLGYKSMMLSEISSHDPEHRLSMLLNHLKRMLPLANGKVEIPYTRQVLADMTGLRVETVIRYIKKMEAAGRLQIVNGKVRI